MRQTEASDKAVEIASVLYGAVPETSSFFSYGSHVFRLDFGGDVPDKVIKIGKGVDDASLLREQRVIPALAAREVEVAPVEFTQRDADFGVDFTVLPFLAGVPLYDAGAFPPAIASATYERVGRFLRRLSHLDAATVDGALSGEEGQADDERAWGEARRLLRLHPRRTPRLEALLERSHALCFGEDAYRGLAHGDGPQFIVGETGLFAAIDWEGARASHPLVEIGGLLVGHGFAVDVLRRRAGQPLCPDWRERVLDGFFGDRPMTEELEAPLALMGGVCLVGAMQMAKNGRPETDDFLAYIEARGPPSCKQAPRPRTRRAMRGCDGPLPDAPGPDDVVVEFHGKRNNPAFVFSAGRLPPPRLSAFTLMCCPLFFPSPGFLLMQ